MEARLIVRCLAQGGGSVRQQKCQIKVAFHAPHCSQYSHRYACP
jgi:hypothetical protein